MKIILIIFCFFSISLFSQEIPESDSTIKEKYGYQSNQILNEYILSVENNKLLKKYSEVIKLKNNMVIDTVNLKELQQYNSLEKFSDLICLKSKKKCIENLKRNLFLINFDFNFYKSFDISKSNDTIIINVTNPKIKKSHTKLIFNESNQIETELHNIYSRGKLYSTYETNYTYNKKGIISEKKHINPKTKELEKLIDYNENGQKENLEVFKNGVQFSKTVFSYDKKDRLTSQKAYKNNVCVFGLTFEYSNDNIEVFKINNPEKDNQNYESLFSYKPL